MLLGLIFVTIIIITSMPLYEGFSSDEFSEENLLAKNLLVTSNYSIKDKTNKQQVFNYFTKYYCEKDSNGNTIYPLEPNKEKYQRWYDILTDESSDKDSIDITSANITIQSAICNPDTSQYYQNYDNNFQQMFMSGYTKNPSEIDGCSTKIIDKKTSCAYWAAFGECDKYPDYMLNMCKASCNKIKGETSTEINQVYNFPQCLQDNFKSEICSNNFIQSFVSSSKNVSNNSSLDPYLQHDGQWVLNMYDQVCND